MSEIAKLRKVFERTIPQFEENFKIKVDYNPESLKKLENTLDLMYPKGTMASKTTLIATGYYVGEVFVRNIPGAAWDEDLLEGYPFAVTVAYDAVDRQKTVLMVQPPQMVADYIRQPINSISRLYQYYKEVAEGKRNIDDTLAGTAYTNYKLNK